jgi:prephenate dehydrogenase
MEPPFNTVTLIGVGLLGGSLGLALKKRGLAKTIHGIGRRQKSLDTALEFGAIDEGYLTIPEGAIGADLIVICTPANAVADTLDALRPLCSKSTVVTDVASTKSLICTHARKAWADPYSFVGSHPMAGSEKFGPEHSDPELYNGAVVFIEEQNDHDKIAYKKVMQLWIGVGAKVIAIDPAKHDEWVARTSHIPHVAAAALAQLVDNPQEALPFIGNGFRDSTRIAAGRPEIWRDICLTNPDAIAAGLRKLGTDLNSVADAIESGDGDALDIFFEQGVQARKSILDS